MRTHINSITLNPFDPETLSSEYYKKCKQIWADTQKNNVPPIFTLKHLSLYTGIDYNYLYAVCHRSNAPYTIRTIKKESKNRKLQIPKKELTIVQKWINKNILKSLVSSDASTAYGLGCSIQKNAEKHVKNESNWFLKLDIKNFFTSIKEHQIFKIFKDLGYPELLSLELTRICTFGYNTNNPYDPKQDKEDKYPYEKSDGFLPQGSCTSPKISNIFFKPIDEEILSICEEQSIIYTRYADDMTFSGSFSNINECINFKKLIQKLLLSNNLLLNSKKTRIVTPKGVKKVTGIIIKNGQLYPTKKMINHISTSLFYIEKYGLEDHMKQSKALIRDAWVYKQHLLGKIFYVRSVNKKLGDSFLKKANEINLID